MVKRPSFLQGYRTPGARHFLRKVDMNSWVKLHAYIVDNRGDLTSERYAQLMMIELEREVPRMHILQRLKGAMDVVRRDEELAELINLLSF